MPIIGNSEHIKFYLKKKHEKINYSLTILKKKITINVLSIVLLVKFKYIYIHFYYF